MMVMMAFVVLLTVMVCMTLSIMLLLGPFHMDMIHGYFYDKWKQNNGKQEQDRIKCIQEQNR